MENGITCSLCENKAEYRAVDDTYKQLAPFLCSRCLEGLEDWYQRIGMHKEEATAEIEV